MTSYVALLRAVNVGGTGKLKMTELKAMGEACGFSNVRTFIASGNLLFDSDEGEDKVRGKIEARLRDCFGKPVPAFIRSGDQMAKAAAGNPFGDVPGNRVMAHFIDDEPSRAMIDAATGLDGERIALGERLIYVAYPEGAGNSKLKLPAVKDGTARNLNSVASIAALLA